MVVLSSRTLVTEVRFLVIVHHPDPTTRGVDVVLVVGAFGATAVRTSD